MRIENVFYGYHNVIVSNVKCINFKEVFKMTDFLKPNVVFSKCLGFDSCRYNGQMINDEFASLLRPFVNAITICPEMEIGLGVPRDPIRVVSENGDLKLYQPKTGMEFSNEMNNFVDTYLNSLSDIDGFILKNGSPSCGIKNVKTYNGTSKVTSSIKDKGFFGGKV